MNRCIKLIGRYICLSQENCKKTANQRLDSGEKIETMECTFDEFIKIVESDKYWGNELVLDVLKMKQDPQKLEEFKKRIFPK